jgi:choline dehydrogenase-like flavoprotein
MSGREIIIAAGAINTAKLLLLSGIGSASQLGNLKVPTIKNLPGVGMNLLDHSGMSIVARMTPDFSETWRYEDSPDRQEAARKQWAETKSGPLADVYSNIALGYIKLPSLVETPEYRILEPQTQEFLRKDSVPHFELILGSSNILPGYDFGGDSYLTVGGVGMNIQSRGTVTLASANPIDAPLIDLHLLDHPFDRRVMIEGVRELLRYLRTPLLARHIKGYLLVPNSDAEDDILVGYRLRYLFS